MSHLAPMSAFVSFILLLLIAWQEQAATARDVETIAESPAEAIQGLQFSGISQDTQPADDEAVPRISFEKTVCDLGDVGQGTKNTCEFKFTNTGQGPLKITHVRRTCGCTVFELDKKE